MHKTIFDIVIVGAGPSACSMALALKNSQLSIAILEKSIYPKDKICGDAIPFEAYQTLKQIDEKYYHQLYEISDKATIKHNRLITPKGRDFKVSWSTKAFNCKRVVFDNQLFEWVKKDTTAEIFQNTTYQNAIYENGIWTISTNQQTFQAKVLVGAGGANCPVARRVANIKIDRQHHSGAVRAYFKNINGLSQDTNEIYFLKEYADSYFWIFPVGNNIYNVGFGLLSATIADRKLNLRTLFQDIIDNDKNIKERFANAERLEKTKGFSIPLGSRRIPISGEGFLLLGDAAYLVEPVGGHGIGTGVWSGKIAADFLKQVFQTENFSAETMKTYDITIQNTIGKRLADQTKLQKIMLRFPSLIELAARPFMKKVIDWLAHN